jgi:hypothetical protein
LMMKIWMIPCPALNGFNLRYNWKNLPLKQKIKTLLGTLRRIVRRNWMQPQS